MCFDFLCDCLWNFSHPRKNSERWWTQLTSRPSYGSTPGISYPYQHFSMPRRQPSSSGTWLPPLKSSDGKVAFVGPCKSRMSPHIRSPTGTVRCTQSKFPVSRLRRPPEVGVHHSFRHGSRFSTSHSLRYHDPYRKAGTIAGHFGLLLFLPGRGGGVRVNR
jgi:hypothetical protein